MDRALYESGAKAWMGGNLFVRDIELEGRLERKLDVGQTDFFSLPAEDAIALFLSRLILPPDEAFDALGRLEQRAFSARNLAAIEVIRRARDEVARIMAEGGSIADFIAAVRAEEIGLGLAPSAHGYLRTVFETSTVTAYSAGRDRQLADPAVVEAVPYRVYRAVLDARTRPSHAALDGKTWDARVTDEWRRYQGPNGFNCRCSVTSSFSADPRMLAAPAEHPDAAFDQVPNLDL